VFALSKEEKPMPSNVLGMFAIISASDFMIYSLGKAVVSGVDSDEDMSAGIFEDEFRLSSDPTSMSS
jgi:hypothetical protein